MREVREDLRAVQAAWDLDRKNPDHAPILASEALSDLLDLTGGLVGKARIVDCVTTSESPWFRGPFGIVLADVEAFPRLIPWKGNRGMFDVPDEVVAL